VRTRRAMSVALLVLASAGTAAPALAAGPSVLAGPGASPARPPAARPAAQQFFWEWSDGVDAKRRTFRETEYQTQENLPRLVVSAEPARPQQFIKLQFKDGSTWRREDAGLTNGKGVVSLELNPYCANGTWCDGTYKYRLLVNGKYTVFTITYSET